MNDNSAIIDKIGNNIRGQLIIMVMGMMIYNGSTTAGVNMRR
jgi:hypothetical protein